MAENADGSIVIDTELDSDGFKKGSDKLLAAVEDLTGAVDNLGDNMMHSFQSVIPLLQNIAASASQIYNQMAASGQQAAAANQQVTDSSQQAAAAVQQTAQAVQSQGQAVDTMGQQTANAEQATQQAFNNVQQTAQEAAQNIANAGQQAQSFGTDLSEAVSSSSFNSSINAAGRSCNTLVNQIQKISDAAEIGFNTDTQIDKFAQKVGHARDSVTAMEQKLQELGSQKVSTAEFEQLTKTTQKAEQALLQMYNRRELMEDMGVKESSAQWKRLAIQIQYAEEQLARYEANLSGMEANGTAYVAGSSTQAFQDIAAQLSQASGSLSETESWLSTIKQVPGAAGTAARVLGTFGSALKVAATGAFKLGRGIASVTFKGLAAGAKMAISRLKEFATQSKNTDLTSKGLVKSLTSLKTTMVGRIKRMFISAIFSQMKEALNSLTKFSSTFNSAMSNLKNRSTELSANMAVGLGNLITAVEPILSRIIGALSKAMSYLNAFFAMLGGKSTMTVAKKQTASYADSLDKAGKSAKELKNQLMGFDEINRMEKQDDNSSGSGSSGTGGDLFEQVPIDSVLPAEVQAYFDRLKAAIQAGDWEGVGRIIAEGLNTGMKVVDNWINTVLRPMGVTWASRIARVLNGLVDGFDWQLFGKTIADGINAGFDIVNTFLSTFNWLKLGEGIGTAINSLFDNIEWDLLGETFANKWNALIDTVYGIVSSVDWVSIGSSLSTFVNSFGENLHLEHVGSIVAQGLNGIQKTVQAFIDGVHWKEGVTRVGKAINDMFAQVDWVALGGTITSGFNMIVTTLTTLIATVDWNAIGNDLGQFVSSIFTNIDWGAIGSFFSEAFIGVFSLIAGIIEGIDWYEVASSLTSGLIDFITNVDWLQLIGTLAELLISFVGGAVQVLLGAIGGLFEGLASAFSDVGLNSIAGFFKGISDALKNVGNWIKTNIVDPVVNAVKNFFGIHSPSTVFADIGDNLIAGLFNGISGAWSMITGFFDGALSGLTSLIGGTWDNIKSAASSAWNDHIAPTLSSAWDGIKNVASSSWSTVKETVTSKFTQAKDSLSSTASAIGSGLSGAWSGVTSTASSMWENVKSTVTSKFTQAQGLLSGTAQLMQSTLSQKFSGILSDSTRKFESIRSILDRASQNSNSAVVRNFANMASNMISNMSNAARSIQNQGWSSVGANICSGIQSGINRGWSWLSSTVSNLASSLLRSAKSALGIHSPSRLFRDEVGENIGLGWAEGIEDTEATVLKTVANVAKGITANAETEMPDIQYSGDSMLSGLDAVANKLSEVAAIFQNIGNMIAATGGLIVPQISAGTVVPYKTRVDDGNGKDDPNTTPGGGQMDLIDALQQMFEAVIQAIEDKDMKVVIGDDAIWEANDRHGRKLSMIRGIT